jgi:hypothetical protein
MNWSIISIYVFGLVFTCLTIILVLHIVPNSYEGFEDSTSYKSEPEYQAIVAKLSERYIPTANARLPVSGFLSSVALNPPNSPEYMPPVQQNFVNFSALGCRYAGYLGPMNNGYFDPEMGIQLAVNAGCRVFVLDIDYIGGVADDGISYQGRCDGTKFFPRICVRDSQGKMIINPSSNKPLCQNMNASNLRDVCDKINFYAFSTSCQQSTDPVVIVLYFQRKPPGAYNSPDVLGYYSNVAKCLGAFKEKLVQNELNGGTYYRQKQEGKLLVNNISNYTGKVLIFSNANTVGFRESTKWKTDEDLDYMVNLRLGYTQTALGITESEPQFGILQTTDDFMTVPSDRSETVVETTKMRWTICLAKDPIQPITKEVYAKVTSTFGVNCVPMLIFDEDSKYLHADTLFKTYSFKPKPVAIRYIKPPVVTPAVPSQTTDAKGGMLRAPQ